MIKSHSNHCAFGSIAALLFMVTVSFKNSELLFMRYSGLGSSGNLPDLRAAEVALSRADHCSLLSFPNLRVPPQSTP